MFKSMCGFISTAVGYRLMYPETLHPSMSALRIFLFLFFLLFLDDAYICKCRNNTEA